MSKNFNCIYCNKNFSYKSNLDRHVKKGCKKIKEIVKEENTNNTEELLKEIYLLKKENTELKKEVFDLKTKIEFFETQNKSVGLETEVKLLREFKQEIKTDKEEQFKTISEIAKQPKNNNNNILNYKNKLSVPFDLGDTNTIKEIQTKLCNTIEYKHLLDGQKSVAKFVHSCIIVDDEGKNEKYVCSDPSRGTFRFKDKDGNNVLDIKALKLSKIVYSAINQRILRIKDDFNNDDDNDAFDIDYLNKNINIIMNLMNDNTEFRNEMINLSN